MVIRNARALITVSYKRACFHAFVSETDEDMPDLATNDEWRGIMVAARKQARPPDYPEGMTQKQLGDIVGCSQVQISKIESGADGSSKFVRRISKALGIPEPRHFVDEDDKAWWQAGHVLRHKNPQRWKILLQLAEEDAKRAMAEEPEASAPLPPEKRK